MSIFDPTLQTLERALDARLLRHNVLAGNLANANTPGYVPRDVDFGAAMRRSLEAPGRPAPAPAPAADPGSALFASFDPRGAAPVRAASADLPLSLADGSADGALGSPIVAAPGAAAGLDGNAVDVDRALTAVAENAIQYGASARAAQKKLAILRYAASDGTA
ncbi:MAG TPA: flagellar basal body protein [Anaeromyxobacteraceae bacterium]|nr:flagellar basal body protein [Anaeromyxobacteraceae bacterium]